MKIIIKDKVYTSEDGPIAVVLTDGDKRNIEKMHPTCEAYCQYQKGEDSDTVRALRRAIDGAKYKKRSS